MRTIFRIKSIIRRGKSLQHKTVSGRPKAATYLHKQSITLGNKKTFLSLGSDCWSIFKVYRVAIYENALSFAELVRVFEVTSLAKLQNCKNI